MNVASIGPSMIPAAGMNAGSVDALGGRHGINMRKVLLYATIGAFAGVAIPVIPGGPAGGAIIGAAIALVL